MEAGRSAASGQVVRVKAPGGRLLGQAFFNASSKIRLRWLTEDPDRSIDRAFWSERLDRALELRGRVVRDSTAYRLISSEADGFPGLIVDRYGPVLVLQSLSLGIEKNLDLLVELLVEKVRPEAVVARNDSLIRALEGMSQEKKTLHGQSPGPVEVQEGDRRYRVDVWEGQKTGAYLDQRENRLRARVYARGRALDAFAYQGGFSLQISAGCAQVLAVEDSEWAVGRIQENLSLNQISNVRVERDNAFDRLKKLDQEGEKFDLVILDPPAFAKSKAQIAGAVRGYREINRRALRILKSGGTLITCSCSYNVSDDLFIEILREASRDAQRPTRLVEIRTQALDHPILLTHPESKYLKCLVLEAV